MAADSLINNHRINNHFYIPIVNYYHINWCCTIFLFIVIILAFIVFEYLFLSSGPLGFYCF
jgi:hypothetical protein